MAGSNFLQWNNGGVNQETDPQYLADSQRTGGAVDESPLPSLLANKLFYQVTTFIAAFGAMMAAKGYNVSDSDINVLQAVLANILTEADQEALIAAVGYSPTPNFNFATASGYQMTLSGNITSSTATGITPGQFVAFYFVQDGVGGRTVSYPAGTTGGSQPDPAAGSVSLQLFRADIGGQLRAAGPMVSNNGVFTTLILSVGSITLAGGAPQGSFLLGNGTSFVALLKKRRFPSWAAGSIQQNLTGYPLTVFTTHQSGGGGGTQTALVGSVNPPTATVVKSSASTGLSSDAMSFEVLPGEFYQVNVDTGALTVIVEIYFG